MENSENQEITECQFCELSPTMCTCHEPDDYLDDDEGDDCGDCGDCESCEDTRHEFYEDDMWADSNALASAGWGTDEDYGYYGDDY
jgi:hypothetical protein